MTCQFLSIILLARALQAVPPDGAAEPARIIGTLMALNPYLSADDPLELPMKIARLRASEYEFFRGTADLFYDWCRNACADWLLDPSNTVLLHGDVHPGNTGTWRSTATSQMHFSLVDLDEVFEGPFQLDLLRALISLELAAGDNNVSLNVKKWKTIHDRLFEEYRAGLNAGIDDASLDNRFKVVRKLMDEAVQEDADKYLSKFVTSAGQSPHFRRVVCKKARPSDLLDPVDADTKAELILALRPFVFDSSHPVRRELLGIDHPEAFDRCVVDVARWTRISSSGSQGLDKYIVLLKPAPSASRRDLFMLQLKHEPAFAAARAGLKPALPDHGRAAQVARAHATLQSHASLWVGAVSFHGKAFLIKPKSPWGKEPSSKNVNDPDEIIEMAGLLGALLGRAHARSISHDATRIAKLTDSLAALRTIIPRRQAAAVRYFRAAFRDLKNDPRGSELAGRAERHIDQQVRAFPCNTKP